MKTLFSKKNILIFESISLFTLFFYFLYLYKSENTSEKIFLLNNEYRTEFKEISNNYLSTQLKSDRLQWYFEKELEQMILSSKNTFSFLQTAITCAINEKDNSKSIFYYQWSKNISQNIPSEYKKNSNYIIIEAQIKYYETTKLKFNFDYELILQSLKNIPENDAHIIDAKIWIARIYKTIGNLEEAKNNFTSLEKFKNSGIATIYKPCAIDLNMAGCL